MHCSALPSLDSFESFVFLLKFLQRIQFVACLPWEQAGTDQVACNGPEAIQFQLSTCLSVRIKLNKARRHHVCQVFRNQRI